MLQVGRLATKQKNQMAQFEELENATYRRALEAIHGAIRFADVTVDTEEPPDEWVQEFGIRTANRMLRYARYGHFTKKEAPIGLSLVSEVVKTERRARAAKNDIDIHELNVAVIAMPMPGELFPVIDVDDEEGSG